MNFAKFSRQKLNAIMSQGGNCQIKIKRRKKRKAEERNQRIKVNQSNKDLPTENNYSEILKSFMNFISFNFSLRVEEAESVTSK